ncbi:ribonuclease H-like domain-containing protein [Gigaspora rosea]|uniref:Ribonuclease H-like domain-containing protein n=1 Tax=Gigaspora rosea TaxID=44941 RepID=A0A397UJ51_9GLOM|nr:ribonuclease H-like domain-containing protein [Gigaspora rosea]
MHHILKNTIYFAYIEKNTIESYIEEFDPDNYETFNFQPFDSTKKFNLYVYITKHLKNDTKEIKQEFEEFCQCYDTYSDDRTCHYRKIERTNDLELVGWYQIFNHQQKSVTLDDIEKVIIQQAPELILLFWDIESSSIRGPGYLPVGEEDEDYVYMIQIDFFYSTQLTSFKQFCLSTIPIEQKAFISKYGNKISCDLKDFHIIILNSQEELLLKFAELFEKYSLAFEIGFNTGGYDWNFILKKVIKLKIENIFNRKLFKFARVNIIKNVRESIVKIYEKEIDEKMMKQYCGININNRNIKAKKTFKTKIKNTLDAVLNRCGLAGKVDLPYLPESSDNLYFGQLSHQLSRLTKISFNKCLISMLVPETILKIYAVELVYYCSVDTLRLQELNLKRNIIGDYTQLASITCTTISNVFMNGVGCLV